MDAELRARWSSFQQRNRIEPSNGYPGKLTLAFVERLESEAITREITIPTAPVRPASAAMVGRVLCIAPTHNSDGKKDVTGAFLPEAQKLLKLAAEGSELVQFDNRRPMPARRAEVLRLLSAQAPGSFDSVAIFCHGWMTGIQAGFGLAEVDELAAAIFALTNHAVDTTVALFCCSTGDDPEDDPISAPGSGDNSFADLLRDALCQLGAIYCSVWAHTTAAHTTENPFAIRFDGAGSPIGGVGGVAVVRPDRALWERWRVALKNTDLPLRAPWMALEEIHRELLEAA